MSNPPNPEACPERVKQALKDYMAHGTPLGYFLESVVCDRLMDSWRLADDHNRENLHNICAWIYWEMPTNLRGEAAYQAHIKRKAAERTKE